MSFALPRFLPALHVNCFARYRCAGNVHKYGFPVKEANQLVNGWFLSQSAVQPSMIPLSVVIRSDHSLEGA